MADHNDAPATFVVVDLGGTKILSLVVDSSLRVLAEDRRPSEPNLGPGVVVRRVVESIGAALEGAAISRAPSAIGIAAAGTIDSGSGAADSVNLPHWRGMPIVEPVERAFDCETILENDGNAAAWGEYVLGAGRGARNLVYLALGTGVGGGIVLDGRLYRGSGGAAGELGHIPLDPNGPACGCGSTGCLEQLVSGTAIARSGAAVVASGRSDALARLTEGGSVTAELVHRAAEAGDDASRELLHETGTRLGRGLIALVNIFNPDRIVIGGGVAKIGAMLIDPALAEVRARAMPPARYQVTIALSELGDRAAALGLASILADRRSLGLRSHPTSESRAS
jgi:glucokinase